MEAVETFKKLTLEAQHKAYVQISQAYEAAKEARRLELRAELERLSGKQPSRAKAAPKYRSLKDSSLVWAGRGAIPKFLQAEMAETGKPLEHFRIK